ASDTLTSTVSAAADPGSTATIRESPATAPAVTTPPALTLAMDGSRAVHSIDAPGIGVPALSRTSAVNSRTSPPNSAKARGHAATVRNEPSCGSRCITTDVTEPDPTAGTWTATGP